MPKWIPEQESITNNEQQQRVVCYSSTSDSIGSNSFEETSARHKRSHSSCSTSGDSNGDNKGGGGSVKKPSMKRQRLSVTPISPDINEVHVEGSCLIHSCTLYTYIYVSLYIDSAHSPLRLLDG